MRNPKTAAALLIIVLLALAVRMSYLSSITDHPEFRTPMLDARWFHEQAEKILDRSWTGPESVFRGPLYPVFLAALYKMAGTDPAVARVFQLLLGCLTVGLLYLLAKSVFDTTTGLLAALLAAFYSVLIYFEGEILIASILPLLATLILLAILRADRSGAVFPSLLAGAALGLFAIARPNILLFLPPAMIWLGRGGRRKAVLFLAGALLLVAPVTARNRAVSGEWILVSSQGGLNFYLGNHPTADGLHAVFPGLASWKNDDVERVTAARLGHAPSPGEMSRFWFRESWREIRDDPSAFLTGLVRKTYFFFSAAEIGNNRDIRLYRNSNPVLSLPLVSFGVLFPLAVAGVLMGGRRNRKRELLSLYGVFYAFSVILFFVCARFRIPILPALFPLAAHGLVSITRAIRERKGVRLLAAAGIVAATGTAVSIDPFRVDRIAEGQNAFQLGNVYARKGEPEKAVKTYREAIERIPGFPGAHYHLGVVLLGEGKEAEGIAELRRAIELDPDNPRIPVSLAAYFAECGRVREAETLYRWSIRIDPWFPDGPVNLGGMLAAEGRTAEAEELLLLGVALAPESHTALFNLGKLFGATGRAEEAAGLFEKVIRLEPEKTDAWSELGSVRYRSGDFRSAAESFRRAVALDSTDIRSWMNLSLVLHGMGDPDGAAGELRRVLAVDPDNPTALKRLEEFGR